MHLTQGDLLQFFAPFYGFSVKSARNGVYGGRVSYLKLPDNLHDALYRVAFTIY
jgi:hypothetical protein